MELKFQNDADINLETKFQTKLLVVPNIIYL